MDNTILCLGDIIHYCDCHDIVCVFDANSFIKLAPGVFLFWGFNKITRNMERYKAIELNKQVICEPYGS